MQEISEERINQFLSGRDQMMGIIAMECGYQDEQVSIIYRHPTAGKKLKKVDFEPFVWAKMEGARKLYIDPKTGKQDKILLQKKLTQFGITVKGLNIHSDDGNTTERLENGYRILFEAKNKMSFNKFLQFFKYGGCDVYGQDKLFLAVLPVEQYMMKSGKRMFKGFEDYDQLLRLEFDLETTGLDPTTDSIEQIGLRSNHGFEQIISITGYTEEEKRDTELRALDQFFQIVHKLKPDVITGHNSENFDWNFIIVRCQMLGTDIAEMSDKYFEIPIYKKKRKTALKLGGEVEYFNQTMIWGHNTTDSIHAVRRAQAIDSNMKKASLKYVSEYSKLKKPNRVYVPGDKISTIWNDTDNDYAFNDSNGDWYLVDDLNALKDGYVIVDGRYIVERYLLDDLYETDKVELRYNQANFLLCKNLPTTFTKVCTMGTAGTWKLVMMAWSYENNLAIPDFAPAGKFTGGLSRLFKVGFVESVAKLDENSLYPAITLTWDIKPSLDITNVMMSFLGYFLDKREISKGLKNEASNKIDELKEKIESIQPESDEYSEIKKEIYQWESVYNLNDKKQIVQKVFCNSFFGSFGAPNLFPWGDLLCAEKITCIGRQSLRLMTKWFGDRGYEAIVMDTDGINFSLPKHYDFSTKGKNQRTYIGKGLNRNTVEGEVYYGVDADVAEFADLFLRGKMGLESEDFCISTLNFSRKNYADQFSNGKIKLVGNSIKSKRMPLYIEKFLDIGIKQLLNNNGKEFLTGYYDYIDRIYNYNIPLIEIASKGRIKKSIKDYIINCKGVNKKGTPNSRQAWYELCIKHDITPEMGEIIYYINIGTKKNDGDVKREKIYKIGDDGKFEMQDSKDKNGELLLTPKGKQKREKIVIGEEIKLNCIMIPSSLIESGASFTDLIGTEFEGVDYNVVKYLDQFNNRINPLLVCFHPDIRNNILSVNPKTRQYFTEKESKLTSGMPNKPEDQDTYEQLMKMEDKEIKYWISVNEIPPFVNEINMDWDLVVKEYTDRQELLKTGYLKIEFETYVKIIDSLDEDDINKFIDDGQFPKELLEFLLFDGSTMEFKSKEYGVVIGTIYDIIDKDL